MNPSFAYLKIVRTYFKQFCTQLTNLTESIEAVETSTQDIQLAQSPGYDASQSLFEDSSTESLDDTANPVL